MRILLVSQMYPSPADPDLGAFVALVERELVALGHEIELVAIDRRGGSPVKHPKLIADAVRAARRFRPDVVYAHFLFPAGLAAAAAAAAAGAPLVLTAHGTDVENLTTRPYVTPPTRLAIARAGAVIAVSGFLGERLVESIPAAAGKLEIIDCGVDLDLFSPRDAGEARAQLGWTGDGPFLVCAGSLLERKNVGPLADAFARLGGGQLAFVGDGPQRGALEGRPGVRVTGRIAHAEVVPWLAAADVVCQPSTVEPFGQVTLEGMAMARPVLATKLGGPPEFVPSGAGVLVDPTHRDELERGIREALALPCPNTAARAAATEHGSAKQAARIATVLERV